MCFGPAEREGATEAVLDLDLMTEISARFYSVFTFLPRARPVFAGLYRFSYEYSIERV